MRRSTLILALLPVVAACVGESEAIDDLPETAVGSCVYENPFSNMEECREYLGGGWDDAMAEEDCVAQGGLLLLGTGCEYAEVLGRCVQNNGADDVYRIVFPGSDEGDCASMQRGCELFAGGIFDPGPACGGVDVSTGGIGSGGSVFQPPALQCAEPLEGEDEGMSEDGSVCTWSAISGCTEEGRRFEDYGSCDDVLTQRPYWPAPPAARPAQDDPRLDDPAYVTELNWVKGQIESCGCVCCHAERIAPSGPSNWFIDGDGNFMATFYPTGLALGAGLVDSTAFGAFPPEDNNGFSRDETGIPTTDPQRFKSFFLAELEHRGFSEEDFADEAPFGGPLYSQSLYTPERCADGEGVDAGGRVTWLGGGARYVYVLEEGAANPGAPPNFDTPEGTLWRLDVSPDAEPLESGAVYGATGVEGTTQRVPADGAPPALTTGESYYLYVLADVGIPITRCVFEAK
jgi:hypothetical protein